MLASSAGCRRALHASGSDRQRTARVSREFKSDGVQGERPEGRPLRVHRNNGSRRALGPPHAAEPAMKFVLSLLRQAEGKVARREPSGAVRLPRVLDRRPRLLPERHPHLPLRRPARQRPGRRRAGPATTAPGRAWSGSRASASTSSTRTTTAASRARTWASRRSCGPRTTWGCWSRSRSRISATTTGRPPTPIKTNGYARHAEFYVARGAEPSVGRGLLHEPQRHRLRRGHEPRPDRRPPRSRATSGRGTTPSSPCAPRRS